MQFGHISKRRSSDEQLTSNTVASHANAVVPTSTRKAARSKVADMAPALEEPSAEIVNGRVIDKAEAEREREKRESDTHIAYSNFRLGYDKNSQKRSWFRQQVTIRADTRKQNLESIARCKEEIARAEAENETMQEANERQEAEYCEVLATEDADGAKMRTFEDYRKLRSDEKPQ